MSNDNDNHPKGCGCGHDHGTEDVTHVHESPDGERARFGRETKSFTGKNHTLGVIENPDGSKTINLTVTFPKPTDEDLANDAQRISPVSSEAGDRAVIVGKAVLDLLTLGTLQAVVDPCGMSMSLAATLLDNAVRNDHANCAKSVAMEFLMKNMLGSAIKNMGGMAVPLGKDGQPDFSRATSLDDQSLPDEVKEVIGGIFGKPEEPTKH